MAKYFSLILLWPASSKLDQSMSARHNACTLITVLPSLARIPRERRPRVPPRWSPFSADVNRIEPPRVVRPQIQQVNWGSDHGARALDVVGRHHVDAVDSTPLCGRSTEDPRLARRRSSVGGSGCWPTNRHG